MTDDAQAEHISKKQVVYTMPGIDAVIVRRDIPYRTTEAGALTMDVYAPPDMNQGARTPVVIVVTGFSDVGARKRLGCTFKEMQSYVSWGRLIAASGLVAVTYANQDAATDVHAVMDHVRRNATALGIDDQRVGIWSCSGHAPNALSLMMHDRPLGLKCVVLCYPYTLDSEGSTFVSAAAAQWGFIDACAGKTVADLSREVPLFIARAGGDQMPGLNRALDRFVDQALAANLPFTIVNHAAAPHAFDLFDDSDTTREIIENILGFLRFHLVRRSASIGCTRAALRAGK